MKDSSYEHILESSHESSSQEKRLKMKEREVIINGLGSLKKWEEMGLMIYLEERGPGRKRNSSLQEEWK